MHRFERHVPPSRRGASAPPRWLETRVSATIVHFLAIVQGGGLLKNECKYQGAIFCKTPYRNCSKFGDYPSATFPPAGAQFIP